MKLKKLSQKEENGINPLLLFIVWRPFPLDKMKLKLNKEAAKRFVTHTLSELRNKEHKDTDLQEKRRKRKRRNKWVVETYKVVNIKSASSSSTLYFYY